MFDNWLAKLKDLQARAKILARIRRLEISDHFGDFKDFGDIGELRIDSGPGYRIYYTKVGDVIVVLLVGGEKSTQQSDIDKAKVLAKEVRKTDEYKS